MSLSRGIDDSEPVRPQPIESIGGEHEERRRTRSSLLATGTLACPRCDAPVAPGGSLSPADPLSCPVCAHPAAVRDFLSLARPTRPAKVAIYVRRLAPSLR